MVTLLSGGRLMAAVKGAVLLLVGVFALSFGGDLALADSNEDFLARAYPTSQHALTGVESARLARARIAYESSNDRPSRASRSTSRRAGTSSNGRRSAQRIPQDRFDAEWASGPAGVHRSQRRDRARGVRVASLGDSFAPEPAIGRGRSLAGGGITWVASASCLVGSLRSVVAQVAQQFGSVTVSSTCRSHAHNSRAGGAPRSLHLTGNAVDFRVHGNVSAAYAFLRSHPAVGGFKHYGGGLFHIDTGARRPM